MQVALGRSVSDEIRPGLHKISKVAECSEWIFFMIKPCICLTVVCSPSASSRGFWALSN